MVDENRDDEVCETHAGEYQSGESSERPESHLEFPFGFPGVFQCEDEAGSCDHHSDGGEGTEDGENYVVRQNMLPFS